MKTSGADKALIPRKRNPVPRPQGKPPVHGLFFDPRRHYLDGRTRIARVLKEAVEHLLSPFPDPKPVGAILIARQCAYKALRLRSFEHCVLTGERLPATTTDEAYLTMSNSLTKDVEMLFRLAKDGSPAEKAPTLAEYLEALRKGKLISVGQAAEEEG